MDEQQQTENGVGAPRRMPAQDLGQLFARPDRTADLGALARRRPAPRPAPAPAPAVEGVPAEPRPALAPVPVPVERADNGPAIPEARIQAHVTPVPAPVDIPEAGRGDLSPTGTVRITAILVSPTVSRRLEEYRRAKKGRTNTSIVLEALDECHGRIPELVAQARAAAQPRGSLFPARDDHLRLPGGGGIQVQIRPTLAQLNVIDRLSREHRLESRSQLAAAVLNEFLPGRKDR
ncbi:hypothetical protein [Parafrankia discariae]|uniref:hypothetical protein n=1 Tax=Parafrankia discariae TaxID=365528 RepID=UPI0006852B47|nr:hypothetical protein [Parafrankia discariae]